MNSRMWNRILPLCLAVGVFALGAGIKADASQADDPTRYVQGTRINGLGVSGMTTEEAKAFIESFYQGKYTLRLKTQEGNQEILRDTDINYRAVVTGDLNAILDEQHAGGRDSGPGVVHSYEVTVSAGYDEELLRQQIEKLNCVRNAKKTEDAYISAYAQGQAFSIVPEVQGNDLDPDKLLAAIKDALNNQREELDLAAADCYVKVQTTADNAELNQLLSLMNQCVDMKITYVFGDETEELTGERICQWIQGSEGTAMQIARDQAAAYVKELADKYDTYGKTHTFRTSVGTDVSVSGPYGWQINQAAETDALVAMIQTGQSQSREPVYSKTAASRSGNDYGNTYVEVDLKNQHMYLYENGILIIDSPLVSGNVSKGWTTPPGLFYLYYKQQDRVLKGEDYETPVKYWMPFNGGIGLHDANWRGKFGGEIYKTGGSHGCINLPPKVAATVYEHVYKNMPVICHN